MAVINDLIERISDPELRRRISDEVARMQKQKWYIYFAVLTPYKIKNSSNFLHKSINCGNFVSK